MGFYQTNQEIQEHIHPILQQKKDCKLKKIFSDEYHKLKKGGIWEVEDTIFLLFEDDTCIEIGAFTFGEIHIDDEPLLLKEEEYFDFFNTTQGRYSELIAEKDETITFQMDYGVIKAITGSETNGVLDLLIIETEGGEIQISPTSSRYCTMELRSPTAIKETKKESIEYGICFSNEKEDTNIFFTVNAGELPPFEMDATISFATEVYTFTYRLFLTKEEFSEFSDQIYAFEVGDSNLVDAHFYAMDITDMRNITDMGKLFWEDFDMADMGTLSLRVQRIGERIKVKFCEEVMDPPSETEFIAKIY